MGLRDAQAEFGAHFNNTHCCHGHIFTFEGTLCRVFFWFDSCLLCLCECRVAYPTFSLTALAPSARREELRHRSQGRWIFAAKATLDVLKTHLEYCFGCQTLSALPGDREISEPSSISWIGYPCSIYLCTKELKKTPHYSTAHLTRRGGSPP